MANASNNGLLPIGGNPQQGAGGGYSQVNPMFGMYYNVADAPTGNSVLGYNMSAGSYMPGMGRGSSGTSATPAAPTSASLGFGSSSGNSGGANSLPPGSPSTNVNGSSGSSGVYGSNVRSTNVARPAYAAANAVTKGPVAYVPPVGTERIAATPKYNPNGPLSVPQNHAIPGQVQANSSGQMQGQSRPTYNPSAWSDQQTQMHPLNASPVASPIQGGNPPRPPVMTQPTPPQPPIIKPGPPPKPPVTKPPVPPLPKPPPPGTHPGKPPAKPPAKKPAPPQSALDKWLAGDTTYQQQLAEYNQEKQAYNQNYTNDSNTIDQNFNATQRAMNQQASLDRMNQQYDFAGRGVLSSGAYATALDQYNTQFQNNMANLVQGQQQQLTANQTNLNNFLRQLTIQEDAAKQDAIARRAALLGITG